jgi:hypothetical protein
VHDRRHEEAVGEREAVGLERVVRHQLVDLVVAARSAGVLDERVGDQQDQQASEAHERAVAPVAPA